MATKSKKANPKSKPAKAEKAKGEMYVGKDGTSHRAGSPKGEFHKAFDEKGRDAAVKAAEKLGLAMSTIRTCLSLWGAGRAEKKAKPAAKAKGKVVTTSAKKKAGKATRSAKRVKKAAAAEAEAQAAA